MAKEEASEIAQFVRWHYGALIAAAVYELAIEGVVRDKVEAIMSASTIADARGKA